MKPLLLTILFSSVIVNAEIHFAVTRYLTKESVKTISDSTNEFFVPFQDEILAEIEVSDFNWKRLAGKDEGRVSRAFRVNLLKDDDPLDSLPYSIWDLCMNQNKAKA